VLSLIDKFEEKVEASVTQGEIIKRESDCLIERIHTGIIMVKDLLNQQINCFAQGADNEILSLSLSPSLSLSLSPLSLSLYLSLSLSLSQIEGANQINR